MLSLYSFRLGENEIVLSHIELIHKEEKGQLKEAILGSGSKDADLIVTFRYRL